MINRSDGVPANDIPTPAELPTTALMVFRLPRGTAADQHLSSLTADFRRIR
jgi:hypothetical protein